MVSPVVKVQRVNKVQLVLMDLQDPVVLVGQLVYPVMMEKKVKLARMLKTVLKVHAVVPDLLVKGVKLVPLVHLAPQENPVLRAMQAQWVLLELLVLPVSLVLLETRVFKVPVVTREIAVVSDPVVLLVNTENLVHADPLVK